MEITTPKPYKISDLKSRIMAPALTSHFQVSIKAKPEVNDFIKSRSGAGIGGNVDNETLNISCCDATLPGSTFQTHDLMAYAGVNERFAYMRAFDDRSDFTFYVNTQYDQIFYFEGWSSFIADEQYNDNYRTGLRNGTYSYRKNLPSLYRTDIAITKFEKSYGGENKKGEAKNKTLTYVFKDAYPISVASIPVSYASSELLKCTVSFTYSRFYLKSNTIGTIDTSQTTKSTTPNPPGPTTSATTSDFNEPNSTFGLTNRTNRVILNNFGELT